MSFDFISSLFLVAPTVMVPLGLVLLKKQVLGQREETLLHIVCWLQPFAALSVVAAFVFSPGRLAAALTIPWLLFGGLLGLAALVRLLNGGWRFQTPLCYTAAMAYLPVGAAWLFGSRAGINPMGFGEPIVLLTAVHFHFSGFATSILAGEVTKRSLEYPRASAWITLGSLFGMPLIAAGFVFSPLLKIAGICLFTSTLLTLAVLQMLSAGRLESDGPRWMLRVSSASILFGMILALVYEFTDFLDWPALTILQMAHFHGTLNAFGFTLCGLMGWFLAISEETKHEPS